MRERTRREGEGGKIERERRGMGRVGEEEERVHAHYMGGVDWESEVRRLDL